MLPSNGSTARMSNVWPKAMPWLSRKVNRTWTTGTSPPSDTFAHGALGQFHAVDFEHVALRIRDGRTVRITVETHKLVHPVKNAGAFTCSTCSAMS